jgi:putative alpha-1,2-mannosidase
MECAYKMKYVLPVLLAIFVYIPVNAQDLVDYVNPFIGTSNSTRPSIWEANGGTYPGAVLPFGMTQVTPENYHYGDEFIGSFSLLNHTSGYPHGSSGNFQIMPFMGSFSNQKAVGSAFQHSNEIAAPGYYSVFLDDYSIKAEMTTTKYAAFFKFRYPKSDGAGIVVYDINKPSMDTDGNLVGKCGAYYFVLKIEDNDAHFLIKEDLVVIRFRDQPEEEVLVKIGFSLNSIEKANENLETGIINWDFDTVKQNARKIWNEQLNQILVEGGSELDKEVFYTALYHSHLDPHLISDIGEPKRYSELSPWDTFRSKQPLITLLDKGRQSDMINSILEQYSRTGIMNPDGMTGVHNVPIIVDSYFKNIEGFDVQKAYDAMASSLLKQPYGRRDIARFIAQKYVPSEISYSVTKTLEYTYDYWAMAQMAKTLNRMEDYAILQERSMYYSHIYNPENKFMTAKSSNGQWVKGGYREGDKWAYNWTAVHDVQGLINLSGGKEEFTNQLDTCFQKGNYFHDNEPPLHNSYLYVYAGQPWKTQEIVRDIMQYDYSATPGGLPGNDDLGALSAWYVFSSMGFFPVCPGRPEYVFGSPIFNKVTIKPKGGKPFIITAKNVSKENKYIQSTKLNGELYKPLWIDHNQILSGGTLQFVMGKNPIETPVEQGQLPASETKNKPEFSIKDWQLLVNEASANDSIKILINIKNQGKGSGSAPIHLYLNDSLFKTSWFKLEPGELSSKTISFQLYEPGRYKISINHMIPQSLEVKADKKATFIYTDFSLPSPPLSKTNASVHIKTKLKNIGSFAGAENVILYLSSKPIDQLTVDLAPGEEREITFDPTLKKEGLYDIRIGNSTIEKLLVYSPEYPCTKVVGEGLKPIMAFGFDEPGAKKIKDLSGLENDAIVHGNVEWVDGIFGKAIKTNAHKDAYIEIPDHPRYNLIADGKIMTIMLWIFPLDEKNFADIISKGDLNVIQIRASNTEVNYYSGGYDRGEAYTLLPETWNRQWHHLAGVSDGKSLTLYIDGKLMVRKELENEANFMGSNIEPWNIGRNASHVDRVFDGYIDHLMVFDKALSQDEVKKFMLFIY